MLQTNIRTPGVYINELPDKVPAIPGASTSNTSFIDFFPRGPVNTAVEISSFIAFQSTFGGLDERSEGSYQLHQYFLNGGGAAFVVRVVPPDAKPAGVDLPGANPGPSRLRVAAASPGAWGNRLRVAALAPPAQTPATPTFNLRCEEVDASGNVVNAESYAGLTLDPTSPAYALNTVNEQSQLIRLTDSGKTGVWPSLQPVTGTVFQLLAGGSDGQFDEAGLTAALLSQVSDSAALNSIAPALVNVLCIPATANMTDASACTVLLQAQKFCQAHRAFLLIDIPPSQRVATPAQMITWLQSNRTSLSLEGGYAAVYYPRLAVADPLNGNKPREIGCSGTVAGIYAATDSTRGVWKSPAGTSAVVAGASPVTALNDADSGLLNPLGINAIRSFPVYGNLLWGARTVQGTDQGDSEWQYINVRRFAIYIESSLAGGLKWAVFEESAEPLWSAIVLSVTTFMTDLFRQGALQGTSPQEAFFVRCDASTTTHADVDRGVVNIMLGFAPLKPAEFVVIQIHQAVGQAVE